MTQIIYQVCILILLNTLGIYASEPSLLIKEYPSGNILVEEGSVDEQVSPCSTFKIVLSLIGYDQ
jgi:beta-lactamase class D